MHATASRHYPLGVDFRSVDELETALGADYLPDRGLATALFLATALEKPVSGGRASRQLRARLDPGAADLKWSGGKAGT